MSAIAAFVCVLLIMPRWAGEWPASAHAAYKANIGNELEKALARKAPKEPSHG